VDEIEGFRRRIIWEDETNMMMKAEENLREEAIDRHSNPIYN
jgi:hypothetical protein